MRRIRRTTTMLTAATAILTLALACPGTASADGLGEFLVNDTVVLNDPKPVTCYSLDWNEGDILRNHLKVTTTVYKSRGCNDNKIGRLPSGKESPKMPYGANGSVYVSVV